MPRRRAGALMLGVLLVAGVVSGAGGQAAGATIRGDGALLQGLDKVTARISEIAAGIGEPVRFGTLEISVLACHKTPPEEPPESTAYLEITEIRPDEAPRPVFAGWMFSSTPGLNALEHAVYDVWVLECLVAEGASPAASPSENSGG